MATFQLAPSSYISFQGGEVGIGMEDVYEVSLAPFSPVSISLAQASATVAFSDVLFSEYLDFNGYSVASIDSPVVAILGANPIVGNFQSHYFEVFINDSEKELITFSELTIVPFSAVSMTMVSSPVTVAFSEVLFSEYLDFNGYSQASTDSPVSSALGPNRLPDSFQPYYFKLFGEVSNDKMLTFSELTTAPFNSLSINMKQSYATVAFSEVLFSEYLDFNGYSQASTDSHVTSILGPNLTDYVFDNIYFSPVEISLNKAINILDTTYSMSLTSIALNVINITQPPVLNNRGTGSIFLPPNIII